MFACLAVILGCRDIVFAQGVTCCLDAGWVDVALVIWFWVCFVVFVCFGVF